MPSSACSLSKLDCQTPDIQKALDRLTQGDFCNLCQQQRFQLACRAIYDFIDEMQAPIFGLPYVLAFIQAINQKNLLDNDLRLNNFEMWLNALSDISDSKNLEIRAKICGRNLPREEYQAFFPLSMGKTHWGSHIVTAHSSPDLDTAVASFWSWVDAFAVRVGTGLHIWNLPGCKLSDQDARVFLEYIGSGVFDYLPKGHGLLTLQASDLITAHTLVKLPADFRVSQIENQQFDQGVILVDDQGYYQGDLRRSDVESIRQVTSLLHNALRWFEIRIHSNLVTLFASPLLQSSQAMQMVENIKQLSLSQAEPVMDYTGKQRELLEQYLISILDLPKGCSTTFEELAFKFRDIGILGFAQFLEKLQTLLSSNDIFDNKGHLIENRPQLLTYLEDCFQSLDVAVNSARRYSDTLGFSMRVKHQVLGKSDEHVSSKADVEEVQQLICNLPYLTVVYPEKTGKLIPLGVIYADTLKRKFLGTVSLRDFSNRDEVKISNYLEIISIVDHHKTDIRSSSAPVAIISDTQSCNTLMAEQQMMINDRYSRGGMSRIELEQQIQELRSKPKLEAREQRLLRRLMAREMAFMNDAGYFVDPERERLEYLFYLYAILDDTDLLAKVSSRDLACVVQLLNRIYSLQQGREVEILSIDDLAKDSQFLKKARERILCQGEMYELYSKVYSFKEESLREQIVSYCENRPNTLFADTKVQNGCARVGQVKLTPALIPFFSEHKQQIQERWIRDSLDLFQASSQVDLYLQMISTIAGAKEVYENRSGNYSHKDELWVWSPMHSLGIDHLIYFLRGMRYARELESLNIQATVYGPKADSIKTILEQNFIAKSIEESKEFFVSQGALIVLRFEASKLNSRKAVISPYLPVIA